MSDTVTEGIRRLLDESTITDDLHKVVTGIAERAAHRTSGVSMSDEPAGLACDFLVALVQGSVRSEIVTIGDLKREFNRWLTGLVVPEQKELWSVISAALKHLEKAGKVQRPNAKRRFNNTNTTAWCLPEMAGNPPDLAKVDQIASVLPRLPARKDGGRILKPEYARDAVLGILRTLGGEVPMGAIFGILLKAVPHLQFESLDAPVGSADDSPARSETVESRDVAVSHALIVREEIEVISSAIWNLAGGIEKGTSRIVKGQQVLCCHVIPRHTGGQKVTLAELGPTSTVEDVVVALEDILREWLPRSNAGSPSRYQEEYLIFDITRGVLMKIGMLCSEKGYCRSFYD
jgi:hypothetical protein